MLMLGRPALDPQLDCPSPPSLTLVGDSLCPECYLNRGRPLRLNADEHLTAGPSRPDHRMRLQCWWLEWPGRRQLLLRPRSGGDRSLAAARWGPGVRVRLERPRGTRSRGL